MFFLAPEIDSFFRKLATIQCACWAEKKDMFRFGNARPKCNARVHLKQRKNIVT